MNARQFGALWSNAMVSAGLDLSKTYRGDEVHRALIGYLLREVEGLRVEVARLKAMTQGVSGS